MDYTTLSLALVKSGLEEMARDTMATFGHLGVHQINWQPDVSRWSVAQCFEHLLNANRLMFQAAKAALAPGHRPTFWQRLPILPGVLGRALIRSQTPTATRKFTANRLAHPSSSDITADIFARIIEQHRDAARWVAALDEQQASRIIMVSPFVRVITYSVLDGCRLVVAHDRRHFEQARRVMRSPAFPPR